MNGSHITAHRIYQSPATTEKELVLYGTTLSLLSVTAHACNLHTFSALGGIAHCVHYSYGTLFCSIRNKVEVERSKYHPEDMGHTTATHTHTREREREREMKKWGSIPKK